MGWLKGEGEGGLGNSKPKSSAPNPCRAAWSSVTDDA